MKNDTKFKIMAGSLAVACGLSLASRIPLVQERVIQPAKDYVAKQVEDIKYACSIERLFERIQDSSNPRNNY